MTLAELLPNEDYRFQMRFQKGTFRGFFGPGDRHDEILAQRHHWLKSDPHQHAAIIPGGELLLRETFELARREQTIPTITSPAPVETDAFQLCIQLGMAWEADFLLLKADPASGVRLLGGCVCFPSSWSLSEKIGHPIEFIHSVVPGLNPTLGSQIHGFLTRLKPGTVWLRANWGLSRSADLNQHPARRLPRLNGEVNLEEVFLRVEHQALVALPETQGVLFGIHIAIHNLADIHKDPLLNSGMARALASLPEEMARYKNIDGCRSRILSLLKS